MESTSNQPAETPPALPSTQTADPFAELRDPNNGLILGKYQDATSLKNGYWEQNNFIGTLVEQNRALQGQANPVLQPRESAIDQLAKEGMLPANLLRQAIAEEAARQMEQAFKPIQDTVQARNNLATDLPEFISNEAAIMAWAQTQPKINQTITALQNAGFAEPALRIATREWQASQKPQATPPNTAGAGLPPSGMPQGSSRAAAPSGPTPEEFQVAMRLARGGDDRALSSILWKDFNWFGPADQ